MKKKLVLALLLAVCITSINACTTNKEDLGTLDTETESVVESLDSDETSTESSTEDSAGQLSLVSDSVEFSNDSVTFKITAAAEYTVSRTENNNTQDIVVTDQAIEEALDIVRIYAIDALPLEDNKCLVDIANTMEYTIFPYVNKIESGEISELSTDDMTKAYNYYNKISSKDLIDIDENNILSAGEQLLALVKFVYGPNWETLLNGDELVTATTENPYQTYAVLDSETVYPESTRVTGFWFSDDRELLLCSEDKQCTLVVSDDEVVSQLDEIMQLRADNYATYNMEPTKEIDLFSLQYLDCLTGGIDLDILETSDKIEITNKENIESALGYYQENIEDLKEYLDSSRLAD
jgi:hypothetical protein